MKPRNGNLDFNQGHIWPNVGNVEYPHGKTLKYNYSRKQIKIAKRNFNKWLTSQDIIKKKTTHRIEKKNCKSYSDKSQISRIYKELLKISQFKNGQKIWVDIPPRDLKTYVHIKTCNLNVHSSIIHIRQKLKTIQKQFISPLTDEWMNKMGQSYNGVLLINKKGRSAGTQ